MSTENEVAWLFELEVKPEDRQGLEALMPEMVEGTKKTEPGSRAYQIFSRENSISVYERHDDSDAALEHVKNFGRKIRLPGLDTSSVSGPALSSDTARQGGGEP
jgi:quinol monooxygenase YgiN